MPRHTHGHNQRCGIDAALSDEVRGARIGPRISQHGRERKVLHGCRTRRRSVESQQRPTFACFRRCELTVANDNGKVVVRSDVDRSRRDAERVGPDGEARRGLQLIVEQEVISDSIDACALGIDGDDEVVLCGIVGHDPFVDPKKLTRVRMSGEADDVVAMDVNAVVDERSVVGDRSDSAVDEITGCERVRSCATETGVTVENDEIPERIEIVETHQESIVEGELAAVEIVVTGHSCVRMCWTDEDKDNDEGEGEEKHCD